MKTQVNMWNTVTCPNCGDEYKYENGVRTPDAELSAYFTTRSMCSPECARTWLKDHPLPEPEEDV